MQGELAVVAEEVAVEKVGLLKIVPVLFLPHVFPTHYFLESLALQEGKEVQQI